MAGLLPVSDRVEWRLRPESRPKEGARTTVICGLGSSRDGCRWFAVVRGGADVSVRPVAAVRTKGTTAARATASRRTRSVWWRVRRLWLLVI